MFEKRWAAVPPQLFASNGTQQGSLTVADSSLFKVKQAVNITANTLPNLNLEIKSILDDVTILVGPVNANIFTYSDISAYTVAGAAAISANEQKRSSVPQEEVFRAVYEEEPVVALRNVLVDKYGNKIDKENPLAVDATVSVVVPPVTVDIDALTPPTRSDPDNVLIVGSEDGTAAGLKHAARVDSELDLRVGISDGANKASVDAGGRLSVVDPDVVTALADVTASLNDIDITLDSIDAGVPASLGQTTMANSMPVTIASNQTALPVTGPLTDAQLRVSPVNVTGPVTDSQLRASPVDVTGPLTDAQLRASPITVTATFPNQSSKISGTENGQPNGTEFFFVNNLRSQILAAKDRDQLLTYADFGTKDQRITQIDYTAISIGVGVGFTARKTLTYTLVGNRYRRDKITWSLI